MGWLYVPGLGGSTSASGSPSPLTVWSVTLNGTLTPRPPWWRGWKNRPYTPLLSGTTYPPSILALGAAKWISSRPASPANPGAKPANKKANPTSGGSGKTQRTRFAWYDPDSCSWRTYQASFKGGYVAYSGTLPRWGSMRSGVLSRRRAWAPRTSASASSSWGTVTTQTSGKRSPAFREGRTPTAIETAETRWPTAKASVGAQIPSDATTLSGEAEKKWATPLRSMTTGPGNEGREGGENIQTEAATWATPLNRDFKDGAAEGDARTRSHLSRQAPRTRMPGRGSSNGSRRLNPRFVGWLMGLPIGWSHPLYRVEPTASEGSATRSYLSKQRRLLRSLLAAPTTEEE